VTPVDVAQLADVPVEPLAIRVYLRHCWIPGPGQGDPTPLWVNQGEPSRWHTHEGSLYVAENAQTVWAEHCRHAAWRVDAGDPTGAVGLNGANFGFYAGQTLNPPVDARALFSVQVSFEKVADFTSAAAQDALKAAGVPDPPENLLADDYGPCPTIAKAGTALGWEAVRYPSAALIGGVSLAVFDGAWPPLRDWTLEEPTALPTVAIAFLTRYKAGERPVWLGGEPAV
jgi:hypothetical protein